MLKYVLTILLSLTISSFAQQAAFPGAEGSGCFAKGGRGGSVYEVTNLSNAGAGSIVDAVSKPNRTVVFRVSGTIEMGAVILTPKSNITIAGQTAPGDGICIKGRIHLANGVSNIVIRYIRVRVDEGAKNASGDAIDIDNCTNVIIDHVSASFSRDEGISCQETSNMVSVQWCIISEALTFESHSYGSLIRGTAGQEKSYHHNLYAHNNNRNPRPGNYTATSSDPEGLHFDFRNNVVYNWKGSEPGYNADVTATSRYNIINNAYVTGVESGNTSKIFKEDCVDAYGFFSGNSYNGVVPADPWSQVTFNSFSSAQISAYKARSYLVPMQVVTTTSAAQAKIDVLKSAGASFPKRDTIDRRIILDVENKTGHSIANTADSPEGGWPLLSTLSAPLDSDHDGMPDYWENVNGLNAQDSTDKNLVGINGYTMLESYLNSLVETKTVGVGSEKSSTPSGFYLGQNYPNPFNPSTTILYSLTGRHFVTLKVFDVLGNETASLVNEEKPAGQYEVTFNAAHLPSGIYFYELKAGDNFKAVKKLMLVK